MKVPILSKSNKQIIIAILRIIIMRPTYAYYGLCVFLGKLTQHILMIPIYIIIIPQSVIYAWIATRRKEEV
tara:strand:- start:80 stop:292 length:213 start_codon:yes stop_codon:yes gene_type:complete